MTTEKAKRPVLVMDFHKGVYYGFVTSRKNSGHTVVMEQMRHCYYWPKPTGKHGGVYTLATVGPQKGAKIGPVVLEAVIHDVSKEVKVTDEAIAAFGIAAWG